MKQSTKIFIATLFSLVVVIAFCIAGIGELAAFFIIITVLLFAVACAERDREHANNKKEKSGKSKNRYAWLAFALPTLLAISNVVYLYFSNQM